MLIVRMPIILIKKINFLGGLVTGNISLSNYSNELNNQTNNTCEAPIKFCCPCCEVYYMVNDTASILSFAFPLEHHHKMNCLIKFRKNLHKLIVRMVLGIKMGIVGQSSLPMRLVI